MESRTLQKSQAGYIKAQKFTDTEQGRAKVVSIKQIYGLQRPISIYSKLGSEQEYRLAGLTRRPKSTNEPKLRRGISKKGKSSSDEQYNVKNQKKDRNVISNLVHHLIKFITSSSVNEALIRKVILIKNLSISFEHFCELLQQETKSLRAYVTLKNIKDLWFNKDPQKQEFALLVRILSRKFYSQNGFLSIFYSNKFNKASKNVHYKGVRTLLDVLLQKDPEQANTTLLFS